MDTPSFGTKLAPFMPLTFVLASLIASGCALEIPAVTPMPNIALPAESQSLDLAFATNVAEETEASGCYSPTSIHFWRESLTNGFQNGLGRVFPEKHGTNADLTLRIDQAQVECVSTYPGAPVRVHYTATLLGKDGSQRRASGLASFGGAGPFGEAVTTASLADALTVMYEDLAKALFVYPSAQAQAPTASRQP
jgi:hypothetical protein